MNAIETGTEKLVAYVEDGIGWMIYNDPARFNTLTYDMQLAVPRAVKAFAADESVRVVVMRGAGDQAFASGADISEFRGKRTTVDARAQYDAALADARRSVSMLEKPVIAMISGYCMGAGLLTALQADIRIAAEGSQFAIPAARIGLGYSFGGVTELLSAVGPAWTAEMLFSARRLSAQEAATIGLVNRVVPVEELEQAVGELARLIAANAPLTVRACKAALREARRDPSERDLSRVEELVEACFLSEDYREGQAAFAEKRTPRFRGR
jgi:enoyl-CoA hydratase